MTRFVACPGRNAICRHLAENLDVRMNTRVAPATRCQGKWLDWSQCHLEEPSEAIQERLLNAFWHATGVRATIPSDIVAHRWRYALPTEPLPDRYLFDGDLHIGACGDWCSGPRVEGAVLSGIALAERLLALDEKG